MLLVKSLLKHSAAVCSKRRGCKHGVPAAPNRLCIVPEADTGVASPPRLNAPVPAAVLLKLGVLLAAGCNVPNPPGVPKLGAGEAALMAGMPAAAAKAGAEVVGEPKPALPTAGAPAPNAAIAVPPKGGAPPPPNAGTDALNAGAEALPNDRLDAPNAGMLDAPKAGALDAPKAAELNVPKAGALTSKLGLLRADPKPPNALEAAPKGDASVEPNPGAGPEPNPAGPSVSRHP